ncbi:MAG: hypothetical protein ABEJ75_00235 [Candidatus Nanohaloarchaea archaeon]
MSSMDILGEDPEDITLWVRQKLGSGSYELLEAGSGVDMSPFDGSWEAYRVFLSDGAVSTEDWDNTFGEYLMVHVYDSREDADWSRKLRLYGGDSRDSRGYFERIVNDWDFIMEKEAAPGPDGVNRLEVGGKEYVWR